MSITFSVIDLSCQQADQSFFQPQISMATVSTTKYAQLHGYSEFIPSSPPKKYRKATLTGVSERIGFTAEETPRMAAGARYTWSGFGEFDLQGVQTASYSKKFFAQCSKQYWPLVPLQLNPHAISPSGAIPPTYFVGYCWPADLSSCPVCDPNINNWPFISDQTTNVLQLDLAAFLYPVNSPVATATSWSVNAQVAGLTALSSPPHTSAGSGSFYNVTVGAQTFPAESAFTTPPLAFPVVFVAGYEGAYINFIDASNYSAVLSEEYTDADALANAQVVVGTGATTQNAPRTTGFVSVYTTVDFTLNASNLIVGRDYLITVDLWEKATGVSVHTPKQYGFTAAATSHVIHDSVPTPADNHTITVRTPSIAFAP